MSHLRKNLFFQQKTSEIGERRDVEIAQKWIKNRNYLRRDGNSFLQPTRPLHTKYEVKWTILKVSKLFQQQNLVLAPLRTGTLILARLWIF